MVFQGAIDSVTRARAYCLCRIEGFSLRKVAKMCNISPTSVWRMINEDIPGTGRTSKGLAAKRKPIQRLLKRGRPSKLSQREGRQLTRAIKKLRDRDGNFSRRQVMQEAGVSTNDVSARTVCRFLNAKGYYYLQSRKKGLLTVADMRKRLIFARKMILQYSEEIWTKNIAFYLDAVSFIYKRNPLSQAVAPKARIWRKRSEGLATGCLAKGRKEGTGGKYVKLIVAVSYDKGVIACQPYEKMTGQFFANFIAVHFRRMFEQADKGEENVFVQDNCPCQNSAFAKSAMRQVPCQVLNVAPKSADVHCIENLFPVVFRKLDKQVTDNQITLETYNQFQARVIDTFNSIPISTVNKLIASMPERIKEVIKKKGGRIKY